VGACADARCCACHQAFLTRTKSKPKQSANSSILGSVALQIILVVGTHDLFIWFKILASIAGLSSIFEASLSIHHCQIISLPCFSMLFLLLKKASQRPDKSKNNLVFSLFLYVSVFTSAFVSLISISQPTAICTLIHVSITPDQKTGHSFIASVQHISTGRLAFTR
jgi:hypothetical protein